MSKQTKTNKSKHGSYVDRFFNNYPWGTKENLQHLSPRDIACLFFEFLKDEGALVCASKKEE